MIVVKRTGDKIPWDKTKNFWYHEITKSASDISPPEIMNSEEP